MTIPGCLHTIFTLVLQARPKTILVPIWHQLPHVLRDVTRSWASCRARQVTPRMPPVCRPAMAPAATTTRLSEDCRRIGTWRGGTIWTILSCPASTLYFPMSLRMTTTTRPYSPMFLLSPLSSRPILMEPLTWLRALSTAWIVESSDRP